MDHTASNKIPPVSGSNLVTNVEYTLYRLQNVQKKECKIRLANLLHQPTTQPVCNYTSINTTMNYIVGSGAGVSEEHKLQGAQAPQPQSNGKPANKLTIYYKVLSSELKRQEGAPRLGKTDRESLECEHLRPCASRSMTIQPTSRA